MLRRLTVIDKEKLLQYLLNLMRNRWTLASSLLTEVINPINNGQFDAEQGTCRWKKEKIKHNYTVPYQLYDWYTDCGRVAQLKGFYIFCPLCGLKIEEVDNA